MHSCVHSWTILAANSGWQQAVAGSKERLAANNGWQQAPAGNKDRLAPSTGWQ
jgi:hypothetical protein